MHALSMKSDKRTQLEKEPNRIPSVMANGQRMSSGENPAFRSMSAVHSACPKCHALRTSSVNQVVSFIQSS